ncbi:unnamed protein product [Aspergillus oryzae]|nr:unnamed protein product [Aspergillus oryzae]GMF95916.1 unnamed protein product [Aspergillus oryzae]
MIFSEISGIRCLNLNADHGPTKFVQSKSLNFNADIRTLLGIDENTFVVTGATSGYGLHLATILYQHGGKVYLAARNASKAQSVIDDITRRHPESKGQLAYLHLDLGDLSTIKKSAEEFLTKESKLHVLWNNAGVMIPPQGSTTAQGYELQLGTNVIGPFLFTKLLYPALAKAAADSPPNSVRVVWLSSSAVRMAPTPAIDFSNMDYHKDEGAWTKYGRSKAANVLLAVEFARRSKKDGVASIVGPLKRISFYEALLIQNRRLIRVPQ